MNNKILRLTKFLVAIIACGPALGADKATAFVVPGFMGPEQSLSDAQKMDFSKVPFFSKTDRSRLHISGFWNRPEGVYANLISKDKVIFGGHPYPAGVQVSGEDDLLKIYMKGSITINGIKICGQLGQHAQTLEIFEIKLCEDSEIDGVKIPAGSKVTFIPHKSRPEQKWLNISCVNPGGKMNYHGVTFKAGEKLLTLSKTYRPESEEDRVSECQVNVWDREMIETLKKSGMIK